MRDEDENIDTLSSEEMVAWANSSIDRMKELESRIRDLEGELEGRHKEIVRLRDSLTEIRNVANCSEGVEFYAMLADQALEKDVVFETSYVGEPECVICGVFEHLHGSLSHKFTLQAEVFGAACLDCGRKLKGTPAKCPICEGDELHYSNVYYLDGLEKET